MGFLFLAIAQAILLALKFGGEGPGSWWVVLIPLWAAIGAAIAYTVCFFISLRFLDRL